MIRGTFREGSGTVPGGSGAVGDITWAYCSFAGGKGPLKSSTSWASF